MVEKYPFQTIEPKWQGFWQKQKLFRAVDNDAKRKKLYVLDMFPYPSGAGLHVGHPEGYTATDIFCRYKRMLGFNVLHPMGWDAFGLPAEQYAIDTGTHPSVTTKKNIENFRKQIERFGFSYDWDREVNTTDPAYVRWTQWIFLQLYKRGLAYAADAPVWWCQSCGAVYANEEVIDGKCERKGHPVERKPMRQWMLKITAYAERLLSDLESLDWPEHIKLMQRHWIGKSEGAMIDFKIETAATRKGITLSPGKGWKPVVPVFTTRPDTLFGATYLVLSPEHVLVPEITTDEHKEAVEQYRRNAARKGELERTDLAKIKTGVFTGAYAVNPINDERIPIWIADYVLASYGTGAIMAVPAHDQRDFEFAKKYNLPVRVVIVPEAEKLPEPLEHAFEATGLMYDSGAFTGRPSEEAKRKIVDLLVSRHLGLARVNYKLRDWLFSRQRYWGEPIPLVHCAACGTLPVPESELPVRLPEMTDFKPSATGEPPLSKAKEWVRTKCPKCKGPAERETNTMPQWAGSCWYYLRYLDPHNDKAPFDPAKEKYWMPVDLYIGGAEHAVLHLLYSRFWHKVLYDLKLVSTNEPFQRLINQGLILGEDGEKMSKSRGNVVNPDDVIAAHGADAFRLFEMFMGPLEAVKPWSMRSIEGVDRFLNRVWRLGEIVVQGSRLQAVGQNKQAPAHVFRQKLHETINKVTEDIEHLRLNTAISSMMEFLNILEDVIANPTAYSLQPTTVREAFETFILLLAPFAPHLCEELWQRLGHAESLVFVPWPVFDAAVLEGADIVLIVQVNGKMRSKLTLSASLKEDEIKQRALADPNVKKFINGNPIKQFIVVPKRLINIVV